MRLLKVIVAFAAFFVFLPAAANATSVLVLSFGGPQSAEFVINKLNGTPYVADFSISGLSGVYDSDPAAVSPQWTHTLPNISANTFAKSLLSTVTLSSTGGTIKITSSAGYLSHYDGGVELLLNYTLGTPEPGQLNFIDNAITGNYTFSYYVNASVLGAGHEDFSGKGGGSFTSLTSAYVPEPGTWAMLIAGLFGCGAALRIRRARGAGALATA